MKGINEERQNGRKKWRKGGWMLKKNEKAFGRKKR